MKKGKLALAVLVLLLAVLVTLGCENRAPVQRNFNFIYRYGVGARNEWDTFKGTYTKDMITAPSITVSLTLSQEEMETIRRKMVEIDFFNYPDTFAVTVPPGEPTRMVTPHMSYYFRVENNSTIKELSWEDSILNKDEKADRLRALTELINKIIESKEEYKKLPAPKGGYI